MVCIGEKEVVGFFFFFFYPLGVVYLAVLLVTCRRW